MSHRPVIEIIVIRQPVFLKPIQFRQPAPKKIIRGPHYKRLRHSIRGRMPILRRGFR
jgi:hypothetical protein